MTSTISINGREFKVVSSTPAGIAPKIKRKAHRMIEKPLDGEAVRCGTLTLSMAPPSVNALYYNRKNGKGRGKTLVYRNWRAAIDHELRQQPSWHVPGKVIVTITSSARSDVGNRSKAMVDALVGAGRIVDDSPKYVLKEIAVHDPDVSGTLITIEAA